MAGPERSVESRARAGRESENPLAPSSLKESGKIAATQAAISVPFEAVAGLPTTKLGRSAINQSLGTQTRDNTYGSPAKAIVDEGIGDVATGDFEAYKKALQSGKSPAEASQAAGGRFAAVSQRVQEYALYVGEKFNTVWGSSDIGAQIIAAYGALPTSGGRIIITPKANGTLFLPVDNTSAAEIGLYGTSCFANTGLSVDWTGGATNASFSAFNAHFETAASSANTRFISGKIDVYLSGGVVESDIVGGTSDWMLSLSGNSCVIDGTRFFCGNTLTQIVVANSPVRGILRCV